jgi:hypothetical protein
MLAPESRGCHCERVAAPIRSVANGRGDIPPPSGKVGKPDKTASNPDSQESIAAIDGKNHIKSLFGFFVLLVCSAKGA